jgi:nitroreductase
MELNEVMRTTFAAREFTDDPLPDEVLLEILENARFAPSGGNRQGNHVIVVRDQATRTRIAEISVPAGKRYVAQLKAGESAWSTIGESKVTQADIEAVAVPPMLTDPYTKSAVLLVVAVDLKAVASLDQDLDRVGVISGGSIYPFIWNILLGARQAGFGGTITTLAIAEEPALKDLLNIPDDYAIAALVPLGRPVKQLTKLRRRPVSEFTTRERFDGEAF